MRERKDHLTDVHAAPTSASPELSDRPGRQTFTAQDKLRIVADQLRPRVPKLAGLMGNAVVDVLAFTTFPEEHRAKTHSTNPLESLNGEIKRRTDVLGIFPIT